MIALQALAAYSIRVSSKPVNAKLRLKATGIYSQVEFNKEYTLNSENKLLLQKDNIDADKLPAVVNVVGTGEGCVLFQVRHSVQASTNRFFSLLVSWLKAKKITSIDFCLPPPLLCNVNNNYLPKCGKVLFSKPRFIEIFFSSSEVRARSEIVRDESRFGKRTFKHFG